jgi:hypothetical protein
MYFMVATSLLIRLHRASHCFEVKPPTGQSGTRATRIVLSAVVKVEETYEIVPRAVSPGCGTYLKKPACEGGKFEPVDVTICEFDMGGRLRFEVRDDDSDE